MIVIDELLTTPKQPREPKPQPRQRVSGLPRAVSDNRFQEMLKKQKEDKERIEAEKKKRKQDREETKKRKEEEKRRKRKGKN